MCWNVGRTTTLRRNKLNCQTYSFHNYPSIKLFNDPLTYIYLFLLYSKYIKNIKLINIKLQKRHWQNFRTKSASRMHLRNYMNIKLQIYFRGCWRLYDLRAGRKRALEVESLPGAQGLLLPDPGASRLQQLPKFDL